MSALPPGVLWVCHECELIGQEEDAKLHSAFRNHTVERLDDETATALREYVSKPEPKAEAPNPDGGVGRVCPDCKGTGRLLWPKESRNPISDRPCFHCDGSGRVVDGTGERA